MSDEGGRRSLTNVGGETHLRGQPTYAALLANALDVQSSVERPGVAGSAGSDEPSEAERAARAHVHGFHTYAARMHPSTASRLVLGLSKRGDVVLDPFCGSGTVLVEARRAGRATLGVDLNPLAERLASRKLEAATAAHRAALVQRARAVAELATTRRKARAGASRRYPEVDVEAFDPHVLLELDGLRVGVERERDASLRRDLELVLSSILVKFSRRGSDTSTGLAPTRIAAGFPTKTFVRKAEDLAARLGEIEAQVRDAPPFSVIVGDARDLSHIESGSVALVVSSPPYAGVYDYVEHHRLRLRWLGLSEASFEAEEIGAKRHSRGLDASAARARYLSETRAVFRALVRVLRPGGKIAWLVADGTAERRALEADELVWEAASAEGLEVVAMASQARPHFDRSTRAAYDRRQRYEHAILLERAVSEGAAPEAGRVPGHRADIAGTKGPDQAGRRAHDPERTRRSR